MAVACIFVYAITVRADAIGPLTSLKAIHALTNEQAAQHLPATFEATVTYFRGYEKTLFVQDGELAIYVQVLSAPKLVPGDRIRITGTTHESFRPFVLSNDIEMLNHGVLPEPASATFEDLMRARYDCRLVKVRAIVRSAEVLNLSAHNSALQLSTESGFMDATVDTDDAAALSGLLDSEVEMTGAASGKFDGKMDQTGILIHIASLSQIKVLKRATEDPWALPVTPMDQILTGYRVNFLTPRAHVRGTITYYQPGSAVVLQSGSKSLWINTEGRADMHVGDIADATGIPDVHDGFLTLAHASFRNSGIRAPVTPQAASWADLTASHHVFDLVSLRAKVVMETREGAQDEYVLLHEGQLFSAIVRHPVDTYLATAPTTIPPMKEIPIGATVEVTGICILEDSNPFNAQVPFDLMLRSFDDIAVVTMPSWLTVRNLVVLAAALVVLVLTVAGWGWMLRRKVRVQTRVIEEQAAREAEQERRNTYLQQQRSRILEDIAGSRPLAEVLEEITELVCFQTGGAPCLCEIVDGARIGRNSWIADDPSLVRHPIPSRTGSPLGWLLAARSPESESPASYENLFGMGTRLASLAIETRRMVSDLVHRSEFDLLTEVHNRFSLDRQLDLSIERARETAGIFGLVYIDLDEFKQINDICGHKAGDLFLQEVTDRMKRQLRAHDMLARLGGDEFAAFIPVVRNREEVEEIASRLATCFDHPVKLEEYSITGSASMGTAIYPQDGSTRDSLLNAADAAMYVKKNLKRQRRIDVAERTSNINRRR